MEPVTLCSRRVTDCIEAQVFPMPRCSPQNQPSGALLTATRHTASFLVCGLEPKCTSCCRQEAATPPSFRTSLSLTSCPQLSRTCSPCPVLRVPPTQTCAPAEYLQSSFLIDICNRLAVRCLRSCLKHQQRTATMPDASAVHVPTCACSCRSMWTFWFGQTRKLKLSGASSLGPTSLTTQHREQNLTSWWMEAACPQS
jgi:hypothetical protein